MTSYYVNKKAQANGDHEVHKRGCSFIPNEENQVYLGLFNNCPDAIKEAKKHYAQSNGCYYCSAYCHTK
ncbi:hypothetical protein AAFN75_00335 [Algibacter sp. AS12]|uniref:hypothetical protein n=1 Tax=Algibacter sp. AS12 TaxID=3135773 RepID=UPI00398A951A